MLYAGIDAGQSATQAVIGDAGGNVLGRGSAGPADEVGARSDSTRLRDALEGALREALRDANLPADQQLETVVAGISGYDGRIVGVAPLLPSRRVVLMHDAPIAHAAALGGKPGVVVIAGTGTVAYAVDADGDATTHGGWGYLFGDEGSAFWIARHAISHAATHADCPAVPAILAFFNAPSMRALVRAFYLGEISRERIAALAPFCIADEREGRGCLSVAVLPAAMELARLAHAALGDELSDVSFVGGLMRDGWFKERTYRELRAILPSVRINEPTHEPVIGALLLARNV